MNLAETVAWLKTLSPDPVSYIVLDPSYPAYEEPFDGHDPLGRRYFLCSTSILDEIPLPIKYAGVNLFIMDQVHRLMAIPMYQRQDMPEGWPVEL